MTGHEKAFHFDILMGSGWPVLNMVWLEKDPVRMTTTKIFFYLKKKMRLELGSIDPYKILFKGQYRWDFDVTILLWHKILMAKDIIPYFINICLLYIINQFINRHVMDEIDVSFMLQFFQSWKKCNA